MIGEPVSQPVVIHHSSLLILFAVAGITGQDHIACYRIGEDLIYILHEAVINETKSSGQPSPFQLKIDFYGMLVPVFQDFI